MQPDISSAAPGKAATMRMQDWGFLVAGVGVVLTVAAAIAGHVLWAFAFVIVTLLAAVTARLESLRHPGPMSPALRWALHLPRGPHSPRSLLRFLSPRPGERVLEVGPGDGVHALPVARALIPGGSLDAVDIQKSMLDALERRARIAGLGNVQGVLADAQDLPYQDRTFDAAFLITVLGEMPRPEATLRELRRVLKSDGRLVIGEMIADPDFVSTTALTEQARVAGFTLDCRWGPKVAYLARFHVTPPDNSPQVQRP